MKPIMACPSGIVSLLCYLQVLVAAGSAAWFALFLAGECPADEPAPQNQQEKREMTGDSPMLQPWPGPHSGVPPWHLVRVEEFPPAFDRAMAAAEAEIEAIADNPQPPTFDNTLLALETAGETLERLETLFDVHVSNLNVGPMPDLERTIAPKLSEHSDKIIQNRKLFDRIEQVHDAAEPSAPADRRRLVEEQYKSFVRQGAKLSKEDKRRLSQINMRLARLFTDFSQNVLEEERRYVTWIDDEARLGGLPQSVIAAMAAEANRRENAEGRWAVTNTRSSIEPVLTYADDRRLRETVWKKFYSRGDHGDERDNKAIISEILDLRLRRAKLLGYPTHAHWRLERSMAKTPEAATELMMKVWPKAVERVRQEVDEMQQVADREAAGAGGETIRIRPWDYRYYAEKVRKEKYDLDFNLVKPYLQLDKLREAMFWVAGELFDLQFAPETEFPVFHPDVRVWNVSRDGRHVGYFYLDAYAREGKRSGAWMSEYRPQHRIGEPSTPIVSNNSNFVKSEPGEAVLISWDDATTLFHEFGHALHGLLSDVTYKSQAGTRVVRDYVEFPSQLLEHWLTTDPVLKQYAVHHETGEPLPAELLEKIRKAEKFNQGFATVEYLAAAIVDMKLHTSTESPIDADAFERAALAEIGMPEEIVMRHRLPHFLHLFSSDSYSAGYYSYLWSDTLTADAAEAFEQSPGGYYDRETAARLHDHVFSVGDTIDAEEGFRRFRGRDVDTAALLRKRGFDE